ncbi:hypothetical protein JL101_026405 [Skermanella rosea]|uniref:3'-5' exonuclease n=1 Tax=Skermanella rosea TaxID=1817965 RepID=UPI0019325FC9|nr:hypothetical protein [Skermanella rosea]UEM03452.1 hypothetical protein JL101_026405 [Skermanella rosea]
MVLFSEDLLREVIAATLATIIAVCIVGWWRHGNSPSKLSENCSPFLQEEVRPLVVLDVEASGLPPNTFPIEIGITFVETGETRTWLIRPSEEWRSWWWDPAAEAIHGISLDEIEKSGLPAVQVYHELVGAIAGHEVLTDSPADEVWLTALFRAAGQETLGFRVWSVWNIVELLAGGNDAAIAEALDDAERVHPVRHRAWSDSARWVHVILALTDPKGRY